MTAFVAMLRAINVAGTGKLAMADLKALGEACGFAQVRTFIASGNLLFASDGAEGAVRARLAAALECHLGRPVPLFVRSAAEMREVAEANPFDDDKPSRVMVHFIDAEPVPAMLAEARDVAGERMALGPRCIFVSYGEGIAGSKLKLPAVKAGTARNINSVSRMAVLLGEMA